MTTGELDFWFRILGLGAIATHLSTSSASHIQLLKVEDSVPSYGYGVPLVKDLEWLSSTFTNSMTKLAFLAPTTPSNRPTKVGEELLDVMMMNVCVRRRLHWVLHFRLERAIPMLILCQVIMISDSLAGGAEQLVASLGMNELRAVRIVLDDYDTLKGLTGREALSLVSSQEHYRITIWTPKQKEVSRGGGDEQRIYLVSKRTISIEKKQSAFSR